MTTPPSSLKSSPRKIPSEISDTRSLASSNFAQLLSKFEVLDAVSFSNSSHASPKVKPSAIKPPSIVGQTLSRSPKQSSQVSIKIRERSSTESSQFSSVSHVPPKQKSQQLRRAQTFGAKAPTTSNDNPGSKTRQMSVAERRMMFETASQRDSKYAAELFGNNADQPCRRSNSSHLYNFSLNSETGSLEKLAIDQDYTFCWRPP